MAVFASNEFPRRAHNAQKNVGFSTTFKRRDCFYCYCRCCSTTRHFKTKEDAAIDPNVTELMMKVEDDSSTNGNLTPIQSPALPYLYHEQEMPYAHRNMNVREEGALFGENKMQEPQDDAAEAVGKAVAALIREIKNKRKRNETIAEIFQLFTKYKSEDEDC